MNHKCGKSCKKFQSVCVIHFKGLDAEITRLRKVVGNLLIERNLLEAHRAELLEALEGGWSMSKEGK